MSLPVNPQDEDVTVQGPRERRSITGLRNTILVPQILSRGWGGGCVVCLPATGGTKSLQVSAGVKTFFTVVVVFVCFRAAS